MAASSEDPQRYATYSLYPSVVVTLICSRFRRDYVPLANLIGIIFQIRDDYVNLQSVEVSSTSPCTLQYES